jgi:hypothetical protein
VRLRRVTVSIKMFVEMLTSGNEMHIRILNGLPEGTQFAYIMPTVTYGYIDFAVTHPSFDELKSGDLIPEHPQIEMEKLR